MQCRGTGKDGGRAFQQWGGDISKQGRVQRGEDWAPEVDEIGGGSSRCMLIPAPGLGSSISAAQIAGTDQNSPIGQARVLHGGRGKLSLYPEMTCSLTVPTQVRIALLCNSNEM